MGCTPSVPVGGHVVLENGKTKQRSKNGSTYVEDLLSVADNSRRNLEMENDSFDGRDLSGQENLPEECLAPNMFTSSAGEVEPIPQDEIGATSETDRQNDRISSNALNSEHPVPAASGLIASTVDNRRVCNMDNIFDTAPCSGNCHKETKINSGQEMIREAPFNDSAPLLQPLPPQLRQRGVSVSWLQHFHKWASQYFPEQPDFSTFQLVQDVVKPTTFASCCAFCQLTGVKTGQAQFFVSHSWRQPFRDLVHCIGTRFSKQGDALVWLDVFALCQHEDTSAKAAKQLLCDLEELQITVEQIDGTLVIMDPCGTVFTRAWCVSIPLRLVVPTKIHT